jgi:glucoamylase
VALAHRTPFDALPADRDLLIDMERPFLLHLGFDGWQHAQDRSSAPLPFGRHGVRLTAAELAGKGMLDFTRYFVAETRWEGADHHIQLSLAE